MDGRKEMEMDDLEPMTGPFDWEEAFRQHPDGIDEQFCQDPDCGHPGCNGEEPDRESLRMMAAALVVKAELHLADVAPRGGE
jgi:hypothetical protein